MRLLAPINEIYLLRDQKCTEEYTTLERVVADMTKVTRTGNTKVFRKIQVGVVKISPIECIINSSSSLVKTGTLLPSQRRFKTPVAIPAHVTDMILWKFSADKGGGSWKFIVNPGNVDKP